MKPRRASRCPRRMKQKRLPAAPGGSDPPDSFSPLLDVLALGPLGRRLLWLLSTPCSHRRGAGLPLTGPPGRLAPRPAAGGGKHGTSVSASQVSHSGAVKRRGLQEQSGASCQETFFLLKAFA